MKRLLTILLLPCLAGCVSEARDIGRAPPLAPVGSGLTAYRDPLPVGAFPAPTHAGYQSLWDDSRADFYRDPRATNVGDVVKVTISIDDRATLDNSTGRSKQSTGAADVGLSFGRGPVSYGLNGGLKFDNSSTSAGQGTIDRSEKINLSIAAVVTEVLPNGNVVISGSQEVRVNYELRVLNITGIVRPRDISRDNTVPYDKIAEARVSYGGRGRLMEVQQPGWGQQIYDKVSPF